MSDLTFALWVFAGAALVPLGELTCFAARWAWRKWRGRKVEPPKPWMQLEEGDRVVVVECGGNEQFRGVIDQGGLKPRVIRDDGEVWRCPWQSLRPVPQPDAPYGSRPDPDDAPVSRREFEQFKTVVHLSLGPDTSNGRWPVGVGEQLKKIRARLDAIEKPVKECGRCGGWARVWVRGQGWGMHCPDCNGTGRED